MQTVVQRSYNAFAVRVQREEDNKRRVLPASETDEGALCIEIRIRLYPDGLMSGLLTQLIKVRRSNSPAYGRVELARGRDGHRAVPFSRLPRMALWRMLLWCPCCPLQYAVGSVAFNADIV